MVVVSLTIYLCDAVSASWQAKKKRAIITILRMVRVPNLNPFLVTRKSHHLFLMTDSDD